MNYKQSKKIFAVVMDPNSKAFYVTQWKSMSKNLGFPGRVVEEPPESEEKSTWKDFTECSSIHGMKYLSRKTLSVYERILWWILLFVAVTSVTYVCIIASKKFQSNPLATVFEDTNYPAGHIGFPAITVCNNNKINFTKFGAAVQKFGPNFTDSEKILFKHFLESLQNLVYGGFQELSSISSYDLTPLSRINLTELQIFMAPDCNKVLVHCWWVKQFYNCCDIFSVQLGVQGVCYSFNSNLSAGSVYFNKTSKDFPATTVKHGEWGGLKLWIDSLPKIRALRNNSAPGTYTLIHGYNNWPSSSRAKYAPAGSQMCLVLDPIMYSTSDDVAKIEHYQRQCLFPDEVETFKFQKFDNLMYTEYNCVIKCIQQHMLKFCGCVVGWMIPIPNQIECNATGLLCMEKYNEAFKNIKSYVPDLKTISNDSVSCKCLPECERVEYRFNSELCYDLEESANITSSKDIIQLDIHYRYNIMTKFRTDLVFGILDLIVAFGGVAGLFMGSSLLSIVEACYFLGSGIHTKISKSFKKRTKRFVNWID